MEDTLRALEELTRYCTNGDRYKTQNPYTVPAIVAALKAIAKARGCKETSWMDANEQQISHPTTPF